MVVTIITLLVVLAILVLIGYFVVKQIKRYRKAMKYTDKFLNEQNSSDDSKKSNNSRN